MNREIKFRGKRRLNGEWVYGNLMIKQEESPIHESDELHMITYIVPIVGLDYYENEVDPSTIDQYTGLKDCNGNEIYEGDILMDGDFEYPLKMVCFEGCFKLYGKGLHLPDIIPAYERIPRGELKIVGNIHDNPELMQ